jgi:bile acid:Na+ symporter, BASS family
MDAASAIRLGFSASIWLVVFGLGLRATPQHATYLFRQPRLLMASFLAMFVAVPLVVEGLTATFELNRAVMLALLVTAVSPVPPILPGKQLKVGGDTNYVYGLLVAASLSAIVLTPLLVRVLEWIAGRETHVTSLVIGKVVLLSVLAPLIVGMAVRVWPARAGAVATVVTRIGSILLMGALLAVVVLDGPELVSLVGNGTVLAIVAVIVAGLIAGHALGGPNSDDRSVLALAASSRHPGVALAVINEDFPGHKLASAAVVLYLLVSMVVTIPYVKWRSRSHAAARECPEQKSASAGNES